MRTYLYILFIILFTSCHDVSQKVSWLNQQPRLAYEKAVFEISAKDLSAIEAVYIYTGIQATELELVRSKKSIQAKTPKGKFLFSGPARLIIKDKNNHLSIFKFIGNQKARTETKDFRSPKTLITDSSLTQQQLVYTITEARNIVLKNNEAASELWKDLAPQAKTYRAQENKAETSFYVEAGSCSNIKLSQQKQGLNTSFFNTNQLKDQYGNQITEGTKAIFYIQKGKELTRIERVSEDGIVKMKLPEHIQKPYSIWLEIGVAKSNKIALN